MAQLTRKDIRRARRIMYNGKASPDEYAWLIREFTAHVIMDQEYAFYNPERDITDIMPNDITMEDFLDNPKKFED